MKEVVYTPESRMNRPGRLFREMLSDLAASRELAWVLMVRNIRVLFRRSLLGVAWAFIPAMATAIILSVASEAQIISVGQTALPYPAYVLFSTTLWQAFLDGLNGPVQALAAELRLLAKFNVAAEPLILSKLGEAAFNFAMRSLLTAGMFVWYKMPLAWTILLAPVGVVALILLGAALGLVLAVLNTLYEDATKSIPILTSFWFFMTPIVYPVPAKGAFALVVRFNPVTPLLVTTQELAAGLPLSSVLGFAVSASMALLLLLASWVIYRVATPIVVERART